MFKSKFLEKAVNFNGRRLFPEPLDVDTLKSECLNPSTAYDVEPHISLLQLSIPEQIRKEGSVRLYVTGIDEELR